MLSPVERHSAERQCTHLFNSLKSLIALVAYINSCPSCSCGYRIYKGHVLWHSISVVKNDMRRSPQNNFPKIFSEASMKIEIKISYIVYESVNIEGNKTVSTILFYKIKPYDSSKLKQSNTYPIVYFICV